MPGLFDDFDPYAGFTRLGPQRELTQQELEDREAVKNFDPDAVEPEDEDEEEEEDEE